MIDSRLAPIQKRMLDPAARLLERQGFTADGLSLFGFALGVLAFPALVTGHLGIGLALILLNRLCDGLDGAVARLKGPTSRGAFLDIALDFLFYALVPLAFAWHDPALNALPAATLVTAFVGTGSSFLAFSTIAAKRQLSSADFPQKGIYYLGGLTEGAETIALFVAFCVWPSLFPPLAYLFAGLCLLTTLIRWRQGWQAFS